MFSYNEIQSLNELELLVYNYVMANSDKIENLTIRELSDEVHVSTTTILRFCSKINCAGYSEFRFKLKQYLLEKNISYSDEDATQMIDFFKKVNNSEFEQLIAKASEIIVHKEKVFFAGIGTSGTLGKYGARFFSNIGKSSQYLDDPFYPTSSDDHSNSVLIVLSVSGEQNSIIRQINGYKKGKAAIISITNTENCTIARISDLSISYYMPSIILPEKYNITTQVPVIYIIEMIARKVQKLLADKN